MANSYNPILLAGTSSEFAALNGSYQQGRLYFCTDTGKLYRANTSSSVTDFTNCIVEASGSRPTGGDIVKGKIYVNSTSGNVEYYTGSEWKVLAYPLTTVVNGSSDDIHVPSAKAVKDAIDAATGAGDLVKSISQKVVEQEDPDTHETIEVPVIGTIDVTNSDDQHVDCALAGLAKLPTYRASDRTFTFTDTSGDELVVTLGKDEFIDPTANNRYESGYLYIYLNVPDPSKPGSTNTEIKIDVSSLVADYVGADTDTIDLTVDVDTHVMTADVIVRPDVTSGQNLFTNALKVSSTAGAKGLYVDLSSVETDIYNLQNMTANSSTLVTTVADHTTELTNIYNAWGWGTFSAPASV